MTTISLDFSGRAELGSLAQVVRALQAVAGPLGIEFFLIGAAARDLMTTYAHNLAVARGTEDVDFAAMVPDWRVYEALRSGLIAAGAFSGRKGEAAHRMHHTSGLPLDIIPFGGVERADRTLAWPPDQSVVFDCFGVKEAFAASVPVRLPSGVAVRVAPVAAQVILKIAAWRDRKNSGPGRDAGDLLLFLRSYMDLGNLDRAAAGHPDLFDTEDFDHVEAGVRLLARDMAPLLGTSGIDRILSTLVPEADDSGGLLLARHSGIEIARALRLLEVLCSELSAIR